MAGDTSSPVYEDDTTIAFMTIGPVNPGHILVVPKQHYPSLADLPGAVGSHCFTVAQRLAAAVRGSGLKCEGVNMFLADGEAAFQEVDHFHLHVFPRFQGDEFKISANWSVKPSRAELDAVAAQIRTALESS